MITRVSADLSVAENSGIAGPLTPSSSTGEGPASDGSQLGPCRWNQRRRRSAQALKGRVGSCEIGQFGSYEEIIKRGSLRGKMALAGACLGLSQLV